MSQSPDISMDIIIEKHRNKAQWVIHCVVIVINFFGISQKKDIQVIAMLTLKMHSIISHLFYDAVYTFHSHKQSGESKKNIKRNSQVRVKETLETQNGSQI